MAKRKLTAEQRATLRKELAASVKAGTKVADVLRVAAKKYGISTITARWYLKSLDGKPSRRGPGRPPGSGVDGLAKTVKLMAREAAKARRLVPRWQALVDKESALRRLSLKLERKLEKTAGKAKTLRARIKELVRS